jgi:hypothetical protein
MIFLCGMSLGFSIAVLLNTKLSKDSSPIRNALKSITPSEKYKAIVPKGEEEEEWDD